VVALPPPFFGLLPTDDIDGAICHDDDSDFDVVPDFIDNCDFVPNPPQTDADGDMIGDACDTEGPSPNTSGVGGMDDCLDGVDNDGDGFTDGADAGCAPGDVDGDGYTDDNEAGMPLCVATANNDGFDDPDANDGCPAVGLAEGACGGMGDDDGDSFANDGCPMVGVLDESAFSIGTSPVGPCAAGVGPDPSTSWPSDMYSAGVPDSTDLINILDLTSFLAPARYLDTRPDVAPPAGSAFSPRYDVSPGQGLFASWINISDLTTLLAGVTGFPPMFGGSTRAFGGPMCAGP
jgi:hypothetical protein